MSQRFLLSRLGLLVCSALLLWAGAPQCAFAQVYYGQVSGVVSGDELGFAVKGGPNIRVRLAGVAAPVLGLQPLASEARSYVSGFNRNGVLCLEVVGCDSRGNKLGWITTKKGNLSLNLALVLRGLADINGYSAYSLSRYSREDLAACEEAARVARRGVWGIPNHMDAVTFRIRNHLGGY